MSDSKDEDFVRFGRAFINPGGGDAQMSTVGWAVYGRTERYDGKERFGGDSDFCIRGCERSEVKLELWTYSAEARADTKAKLQTIIDEAQRAMVALDELAEWIAADPNAKQESAQ